ncbi:MAG: hypothetical protein SGILL_004757 [Bacillariaceae sp.]
MEAVKSGHKDVVPHLLREKGNLFCESAFLEASEQREIELSLAMAAKFGSEWAPRFFVSINRVINAPIQGRACIQSTKDSPSLEGFEVLVTYGYKLDKYDLRNVCRKTLIPQDLRMTKFLLAGGTQLNGEYGKGVDPSYCLPEAVLRDVGSPLRIELVRMLLLAGADPNKEFFDPLYQIMPPSQHPALYYALKNRDREMVTLLRQHGAESSTVAHVQEYRGGRLVPTSMETIATEEKMSDVLTQPVDVVKVDPKAYIAGIRREFIQPLKPLIADYAAAMVVAMMRSTGCSPRVGLVSKLILEYVPLGFDLWKIETKD